MGGGLGKLVGTLLTAAQQKWPGSPVHVVPQIISHLGPKAVRARLQHLCLRGTLLRGAHLQREWELRGTLKLNVIETKTIYLLLFTLVLQEQQQPDAII